MKHLIVYQITYKKVIYRNKCQNKDAFIFHERFFTFYKYTVNQVTVCSCSGVSSLKNSDNETY